MRPKRGLKKQADEFSAEAAEFRARAAILDEPYAARDLLRTADALETELRCLQARMAADGLTSRVGRAISHLHIVSVAAQNLWKGPQPSRARTLGEEAVEPTPAIS
jgi:hypothetical protein